MSVATVAQRMTESGTADNHYSLRWILELIKQHYNYKQVLATGPFVADLLSTEVQGKPTKMFSNPVVTQDDIGHAMISSDTEELKNQASVLTSRLPSRWRKPYVSLRVVRSFPDRALRDYYLSLFLTYHQPTARRGVKNDEALAQRDFATMVQLIAKRLQSDLKVPSENVHVMESETTYLDRSGLRIQQTISVALAPRPADEPVPGNEET